MGDFMRYLKDNASTRGSGAAFAFFQARQRQDTIKTRTRYSGIHTENLRRIAANVRRGGGYTQGAKQKEYRQAFVQTLKNIMED